MKSEVEAVMLFIAELTGSFEAGSGTEKDKIACGQKDYRSSNLLNLDLTDEDDLKDLHENMWLERLYEELDFYFNIPADVEDKLSARWFAVDNEASYREGTYKWSVPIELDASASLLQYMGLLLNDKRLLEMTNVIGDTLEDPWQLKGISRAMLKKAATPMLYGSAKSCEDLWKAAKMPYKPKHVKIYAKEMSEGPFGLVNMFKDFIISSCNPEKSMEVKIGDDEFTVGCNRFRNVGDVTKAYKIWSSSDELYNVVLHTDTKKVPDLERFRRYFVTLLIHNLDSQVADVVSELAMEKYGWCIPIHDAFVISPAAAVDVRKWYAKELEYIRANRKEILANFFKSIGITGEASEKWEKIKSKVVPFEGKFTASSMALK